MPKRPDSLQDRFFKDFNRFFVICWWIWDRFGMDFWSFFDGFRIEFFDRCLMIVGYFSMLLARLDF